VGTDTLGGRWIGNGLAWYVCVPFNVQCSMFNVLRHVYTQRLRMDLVTHIWKHLLPYMDRRLLTYLVSPTPEVNLKKINPCSFFAIPPPWCPREKYKCATAFPGIISPWKNV